MDRTEATTPTLDAAGQKPAAVALSSPAMPRTKGQLKREFIDALKVDGKSKRTIESYCAAVTMFQNFIRRDPLQVSANDLRAFFLTWWLSAGTLPVPTTRSTTVYALSTRYSFPTFPS